MGKKWYEHFVSVENPEPRQDEDQPAVATSRSAAQTVAQITSSIPTETKFTSPINNPGSFDDIYRAAEITAPAHGYTILKVAEMLQSEYIRNLAPSVKRSSILVALEAASVKVQEIIQDAVRRDKALDTYERVQEKSLEQLRASKDEENRQIQAEMDRLVEEHRARIQRNTDMVAKEKERFFGWRLKKQQEEQRIADAVGYFTSENPITTTRESATPPQTPPPQRS